MQPVDQQQWNYPPSPSRTAEPRARAWMTALTAVLVEIVVIAAISNQGLSDNMRRFVAKHETDLVGQLARTTQVYAWRLSSSDGGPKHFVLSQYALLATLFVLTAALVYALARGAVTFGRVFLGVWLSVIVATQVGSIVQNCVADVHPDAVNRFTYALFAGPSGYHFVAGLALGLLAALIAALVAVATRPAGVAGPSEPTGAEAFETPPRGIGAAQWREPDRGQQDSFATTKFPTFPPAAAPAPSASAPPAPSAPGSAPPDQPAPAGDATVQLRRPSAGDDPNRTTVLPSAGFRTPEEAPRAEPPRAPQYPRPPDDEDLGHQPE